MTPAIQRLIYIGIAISAALLGFLLNQQQSDEQTTSEIAPIVDINNFALPDYLGLKMHQRQEWAGKVIMLNFWATWCPPCKVEIPDFIRLQEDLGEQGLQVVGIALDRPEMVAEFAAETPFNYPSLIADDQGYALLEAFGSEHGTLPFTVFIDRNGNIAHRHWKGILHYDDARSILEPLLKK